MNEIAIFEFIVDTLKEREEIVAIDGIMNCKTNGKLCRITLFIFQENTDVDYVPLLIEYTEMLRPLEGVIDIKLIPLHIDTRYKFTSRLPELKTIYKKDDNT